METWIGNDVSATLAQDSSYVVDLKKNVFYMVSHKTKSYVESALPLDFTKLLPPEAAAMAGMFKMTAKVTPTTETKKIGQWNSTRYNVTMTIMGMNMQMTSWASTEVPFDVSLYSAKLMGPLLKGQMHLDDASVQEMMKIKGYQIASETVMEMMGAKVRTTTEVLEISQKAPPAGTYAPPAGYAKKPSLSMQDLQKH